LKLNPEFELGSYDLLFDFAEKNLGIACITEEFSKPVDNSKIFKLKTDFSMPERSVGICTLANVPLSPAVIRLIDIIEATVI
jgi:DNA-binding transcriptional LysR family regulator